MVTFVNKRLTFITRHSRGTTCRVYEVYEFKLEKKVMAVSKDYGKNLERERKELFTQGMGSTLYALNLISKKAVQEGKKQTGEDTRDDAPSERPPDNSRSKKRATSLGRLGQFARVMAKMSYLAHITRVSQPSIGRKICPRKTKQNHHKRSALSIHDSG